MRKTESSGQIWIAYSQGSVSLGIHLCDCWFDIQNAACRADILIHETYHLLGLHDKDKGLDSANAMTQLVNGLDGLSTNNCTSC